MGQKGLFVTLGLFAGSTFAAAASRPRGVGPEFAKFYQDQSQFTCISNPSIKLPISHVNDDFCDCPDGSDEPGTSACTHLTTPLATVPGSNAEKEANSTLALPGYYCKNKGHQPSYIPFNYVNDGVCDYSLCCDGSDEWAAVGGVKCEDRCKDIGKKWREQTEARARSLNAAAQSRKALVDEAKRLRKEVTDEIVNLNTLLKGQEENVLNLEKQKVEMERREKSRVVKSTGSGGRIGVLTGLAKQRIESLQNKLGEVKGARDDYQARIATLEKILSTFKEEYNPNFNDEGVKRAARSWEDYVAGSGEITELLSSAPVDSDLDGMIANADPIPWDEFQGGDEPDDIQVLFKLEEYLPSSVRKWLDQKLRELRQILVENGVLAPLTEGQAADSPELTEAKKQLDASKSELERYKSELKNHQENLDKDYGVDEVFRPMASQCVSLDSGEYTYELCWMDKVTQISKKGGSRNDMGRFEKFGTIYVDEILPPDGKGLGTGDRITMKYENGAHCWNGPNRSATIILACAEKNEIWKITEEEKCVYRIEAGTPAVCEAANAASSSAGQQKDEL